ncbi:hypothetical protein FHG87_003923 [Trinorchestia longiramus]|nr:hypothetical protein FHG87_003923 [Trinorchestia longiramus]
MDHASIKSAVLQAVQSCYDAVDHLLQDAPSELRRSPDSSPLSLLLCLMGRHRTLLQQRLQFSARLEYLYASTLANQAVSKSESNSTAMALEKQVQEAKLKLQEVKQEEEQKLQENKQLLQQLDEDGRSAVSAIRKAAAEQQTEARQQSRRRLQQLEETLSQATAQQAELEKKHRLAEAKMRQKRQEMEGRVLQVITEYDTNMTALQAARDHLVAQQARAKERVRLQQEELAVIKKKHDAIAELHRQEEEKRMLAIQAEFCRERSARTIQRAWQHYKIKKMLKKAQKKGKKKKLSIAQ